MRLVGFNRQKSGKQKYLSKNKYLAILHCQRIIFGRRCGSSSPLVTDVQHETSLADLKKKNNNDQLYCSTINCFYRQIASRAVKIWQAKYENIHRQDSLVIFHPTPQC